MYSWLLSMSFNRYEIRISGDFLSQIDDWLSSFAGHRHQILDLANLSI
jgi:hypothetical protein